MFNYKKLYTVEQFGEDDWYKVMESSDDGLSWNQARANLYKTIFFCSDANDEKYKHNYWAEPTELRDLDFMKSWLKSLREQADRDYEATQTWRTVEL